MVLSIVASCAVALPLGGRAALEQLSVRSQMEACEANLRQIENIKGEWASDEHERPGATVTERDIFHRPGYIMGKPECPAGGSYSIGKIGEAPNCSLPRRRHGTADAGLKVLLHDILRVPRAEVSRPPGG